METHQVIASFKERVSHYIESKLYEARVNHAIYLANQDVERAFQLDATFSFGKILLFIGLSLLTVATFGVLSYAVTFSPDTPLEQLTSLTEPVKPKSAGEPPEIRKASLISDQVEASPGSDNLSAMPDLSLIPRVKIDLFMPDVVAPYVLVVDKSREELLVLEENKDNYKIVKRYKTALGSLMGDKSVRGDLKTPEGLYNIVGIKEDKNLPSRYGPRAFVLGYPNKLDKKMGKTGSGIWIHGSGLGTKVKATEGCVEVNDLNVKDLGQFADVGTQVYIFPEKFEIPIRNGAVQKDIIKPDTVYAIKRWWAAELKKRGSGLLADASRPSGS